MANIWNISGYIYTLIRTVPGVHTIYQHEKAGIRELLSTIHSKESIIHLDLGSGNGSSFDLFPIYWKTTAVDSSSVMLKKLQKKFPNVNTVELDITDAIPDGFYHLITVIGVTEYIDDLQSLLHRIIPRLTSGGLLLITAAPPNFYNQLRRIHGHKLYFREDSTLKFLLESTGFKIIDRRSHLLQHQFLCQLK